MKKILLIICLSLINNLINGQEILSKINIHCTYQNEEIQLNKKYYSEFIKDSIQFNALKFYIGNVCFISENKEIDSLGKKYHLLDWSDEKSRSLFVSNIVLKNKKSISFNIGVDSITNNEGALGGDLDPVKGMYWAWQTGYINFKLEGKSPICPTRNNEFTFHLGGFLEPFYAMQSLTFPINYDAEIVLVFELDDFLKHINLSSQNHFMSPSADAVYLSKKVAESFKIVEN